MIATAAQKTFFSLFRMAAIAEKRSFVSIYLPMRPWKWTKTTISLPHRQGFAHRMAISRNCGGRRGPQFPCADPLGDSVLWKIPA
jgi:hypothetical protein